MSSADFFRRRELQCHQSVSVINDRSSYDVRRVSELDVLSAIGSVMNASRGRGVTRFVQCEATRETWLRVIERALLERHLTRLLRFSPSLDDTCKHFRSDLMDTSIGAGLDAYNALVYHTVFALIDQDAERLGEAVTRPERLVRMLYCVRQKALPMLVAWLLGENTEDCESYLQLMRGYEMQRKVFDTLRLSVRQELQETRVFITEFLSELETQSSSGGVPMATHIPETFVCDGRESVFSNSDEMLSFKDELDELHSVYEKAHCSEDSLKANMVKDILDPSLRCRAYKDPEDCQTKYQWLPTEFQVGVDGNVTVLSPLHGSVHVLHYPRVHTTIPQLLGRLLPLFEQVLGSIITRDPPPPQRIGLGSTHLSNSKLAADKKANTKPQILPPFNNRFGLRDRHLQVAVKLSTIQLDEVHPVFPGEQGHAHFNRG